MTRFPIEINGPSVCMASSLRSKDISGGRFRAADEAEVVLSRLGSGGGSNCMDYNTVSGITYLNVERHTLSLASSSEVKGLYGRSSSQSI